MGSVVVAVARSASHRVRKDCQSSIRLLEDLGVEGDAHQGRTVQHRSRVARDATQPNLRQVHLMHSELHDELRTRGFDLAPGEMGENITTRGLELLDLPTGTHLHIGTATIEITGLRNPCAQLDGLRPGLRSATLERDADGALVRKAGVMGVVISGGEVRPGDAIEVRLPPAPHAPLAPV